MLKRKAMAMAIGGLSMLTGCSTLWGPQQPAPDKRAGTIEPLMKVHNSRGVDSEAMYRIGRYYQGLQQYDDAVLAYRRALALDAKNVEALNALGTAYSILGRSAEAERTFKSAIAVAPRLSHLHSNLGYHYLKLGRNDAARAELREAIRLDSANAWAWSNLAAAERGATAAAPPAAPAAKPAPPAAIREIAERPAAPAAAALPPLVVTVQVPAPSPVLSVPSPAAAPAAAIAERIELSQIHPAARLLGVAPGVWELRPRNLDPSARVDSSTPAVPSLAAASPAPPAQAAAAPAAAPRVAPFPSRIRMEISNGNGINDLARSVGRYLRSLGASQARLTNRKPFDQKHTEIEYLPGMDGWARELRGRLETPARLVERPYLDRAAQLRLVLGKDFHEIDAVARLRREIGAPVLLARGAGHRK